jgi:RNA polymerase sigma-70 factor (ECF subfamily)
MGHSPSEDSDTLADLLRQTAHGDRAAFRRLYLSTSAKLYGVIARIVGNADRAEDVLQEAYIRIWRHAGDYKPELAAPVTWMATIARNRALDWRRRQRDEAPIDLLPESTPGLSVEADWSALGAEGARLRACVEALPDEQRECMVLAYMEGLTHQELAARLDRPLGTIKSWIRRGLGRLKRCLEG